MLNLYGFQQQALRDTSDRNRVAYYLDMGLGKTFVGSEKMHQLGAKVNLVICQKSKIDDWVNHFKEHYTFNAWNLSNKKEMNCFYDDVAYVMKYGGMVVGFINYELAFRRPELLKLTEFTLMLDESSLIQNESAKRTKFIMKMKPANVILLSGTPVSGKYERLISQIHLLGWNIAENTFWNQYVNYHYDDNEGFPLLIVDGYKNTDRLIRKMHEHGCVFMKTDEVFELPEQIWNDVKIPTTKEYKNFRKSGIVTVGDDELVGDCTLTKMLYERMLCGHYNQNKISTFRDLLESTSNRVIVFYNFDAELREIENVCLELDRPTSIVNGHERDLYCYEQYDDAVVIVQYQAGSMGLNLQASNRIVYFTPPLSCELYAQSKKRIHRIGQQQTCFYYRLICESSIEKRIYNSLERGIDYTDKLFEKDVDYNEADE